MKKTCLIILFCIAFFTGFTQQPIEYIIEMEFENRSEVEKITKLVSIVDVQNYKIIAYTSSLQLLTLDRLGYDYKILPNPDHSSKVINMASTVDQMASWDRYPTYEVYIQMMQKFADDYPEICRLDTIGLSVNGRLLLAVKISDNVNLDEAEPEVFYTATMHGDETTGFVLHLRLINYLLSNYGTDSEVNSIVDNMAVWINPSANPDGSYKGGNNSVNGSTRSNANGIDLNRNFPDPKGGDHPDGNSWQVETIAMMDFAAKHKFVLSQNTHGGVEVVNYPWDTWARPHPDDNWWVRVSRNYADMAHSNSPSGYMVYQNNGITNGYDWYSVEGGRQDYMNYFYHCREMVLELSDVKLLSSDLLPEYWLYNKQALLNYMKEALYGINGVVTNTSNEPLSAEIEVLNHDADCSSVITDPNNGDYYRPIEAGSYTLKFSAYGYISQVVENVETIDGQATELNVVLEKSKKIDVSGTVTDLLTGLAIEGATLTFINTNIEDVVTDVSGKYLVKGILESEYVVRVSANGYAPIFDTLTVSTESKLFDFEMAQVNAISFEDSVFVEGFSTSGAAGWTITKDVSFDGKYSARSGKISDDQSSILELTFEYEKSSFFIFTLKVSSEGGNEFYDGLKFYIDGIFQGQWSGDIDWTEVSYPVAVGEHVFKWEYIKDNYSASGEDAAWIDFIILPKDPSESLVSFSSSSLEFVLNDDIVVLTDSIKITNIGQETLQYTAKMQANTWAKVVSNNASLEKGKSDYIKVQASLGNLNDGIYMDQLLVSADDLYIIPVELNVGNIGINQRDFSPLTIYPNPSDGQLNIVSEDIIKNVTVFNACGLVLRTMKGDDSCQLKFESHLKSGLYFVSVETNLGVKLRKFIVE